MSVISIIGEECKLDRLGRIADLTGGEVERVSPLTLMDNFNNILERPILATKVSATMFLHKGFYFRNADADPDKAQFTITLGNVNEDAEAFYEFGVRREFLPHRAELGTEAVGTAGADAAGEQTGSATAATSQKDEETAASSIPKLSALPFQV